MMNPYEADPEKIPPTDLYADVPLYGRYYPKPDDFRVDFQHVNSQTTDSLRYWTFVVGLCTEQIRIYPSDEGGRDVFALGSVIVKSGHLHAHEGAQYPEIDFSYADANEIQAIGLAKTVLKDIKVPEIYFSGKVLTSFLLLTKLLLRRLNDSCPLRSMVTKCSSKKGFQVLHSVLHGLISQKSRKTPTKNKPGKYSVNFTLSSPQKTFNFNLALTWSRTQTYLSTVESIN
ncbi:hypothetical protein DTO164E3_4000 [Paecilomyces variotii]|nr:hypothetical protein DTO164E3_4000 [Paecilomyces variotii]